MIDNTFEVAEITDFRGPWTLVDPADVPPTSALLARNVEYERGQVATRRGHAEAFNPAVIVRGMANWITSTANRLVYYDATNGKVFSRDLTTGVETELFTSASAHGMSVAVAGTRVYVTLFNSSGVGQTEARIWDGLFTSAVPNVEKAFTGPLTGMTLTGTEPGAGVVTAGLHKIGCIFTSKNGFTGKFSPVDGSQTFTPISFTSAGSKNLNVKLSTGSTWPNWAATVQIIMTTTENLARYYLVPGAVANVPTPGSSLDINIICNTADADLILHADTTEATEFQNFLTQDSSGNGPFNPFKILEYGNRLIWLTERVSSISTIPTIYASEPNNYQAISEDQHTLFLPGHRQIRSAFVVRGILYVVGPHWTYAFEDNGEVPVLWPPPLLIDGSIGTLCPNGVTVNAAQGFAWVADEGGLYVFSGGAYAPLPISYYQSVEWKRINWTYAQKVQVIDDKNDKKVRVLAPLDAATEPSHILTWDYTDGLNAEQANFSLDNLASYNPASIAVVQNNTTKRLETWLGPSSAGRVLRQVASTESNPYRDYDQPITSVYQTALLPNVRGTQVQTFQHHGAHMRVKGAGTLNLTVYPMDDSFSLALSAITLASAPGIEIGRFLYLINELLSYKFETNALDAHFLLSSLKHYYSPFTRQR